MTSTKGSILAFLPPDLLCSSAYWQNLFQHRPEALGWRRVDVQSPLEDRVGAPARKKKWSRQFWAVGEAKLPVSHFPDFLALSPM
jgi:hypothetical protein